MKDTKKRRLNVISSTFFTIVGLLACFTGTMAWFTSIRMKQGAATEFETTVDPLPFSKVQIFKQDSSNATKEEPYCFSTTASGTYTITQEDKENKITYTSSGADANLDSYDSFSVPYTQCILYLFTVKDNVSQSELDETFINVKRKTDSRCLFVDGSNNLLDEDKTKNPISNILSFQVVPLASNLTDNGYYHLSSSAVTGTTSQTFIDKTTVQSSLFVNDEASQYHSSLSLFESSQGTYTTESGQTNSLTQVALIISYDPVLINALYTINLGNEVLDSSGSDSIGFTADWSFVI